MEGLIVLAIAAAIALMVIGYMRGEERKKQIRAEAARLGLTYAPEPPFGPRELPFPLFERGDGAGLEHHMHGARDGLTLDVFGFWYYEERTSTNAQGHLTTSRDYHRFTCCLVPAPVPAPPTTIELEGFLSGVARLFGVKDIQFESERFNRKRKVHSDDPRFANYLIDARMMEYLVDSAWCFAMSGTTLLVYTERRFEPGLASIAIQETRAFLDRVPRVVLDVYGGTDR